MMKYLVLVVFYSVQSVAVDNEHPYDSSKLESKIECETVEKHLELSDGQVFDHSVFNILLQAYVSKNGVVNYKGFTENKMALQEYITSLSDDMPRENWIPQEKLAYWMNAYNALTIDLIIRHYPIKSIKDIKDPWGQKLWKLGDTFYSLNDIEHQILRKMGDARIHFGINCASYSCPPLLNEAFSSKLVDAQLDALSRQFINDTIRNSLSINELEISKIFNWFAKDFKKNGSLIDFLNLYSETTIAENAKIKYKEYNWNLNE